MRFLASLLLLCVLGLPVAAQQRIVVSGQVVEAASGEPVPFASVFVPKSSLGATADMEGRFKIVLSTAVDSLAASSLGFLTGIRAIGGLRAGILMLFEPVVGVALAAWLLNEALAPIQAVGALAILAAAVILQRAGRPSRPAGRAADPGDDRDDDRAGELAVIPGGP